MSTNKITTTLESVNNGINYAVLTGISDIYPYENGKKIGDNPIGKKIEIALQGNNFKTISVKIESNINVLQNISNEQISSACSALKLIPVRFTDCVVHIYSINNNMIMTATASNVEIVPTK